jgi:hydroxymethylglutaryl-CoA lyase
MRGYERALAAGVREVEVVVGVSDSFSRHNVNMGTEESFAQGEAVLARARGDGVRVRIALATAFGCPYEGAVPAERVVALARRAHEAGADEISVADTSGVANPRQAYDLFSRLVAVVPASLLVAHFHDTWGRGLANVVASLDASITAFDASVGGLGGCPYCPGAAGNIATEDLVAMLEEMDIATGVDLCKLLEAADLARSLVDHQLPSHALVAGRVACKS